MNEIQIEVFSRLGKTHSLEVSVQSSTPITLGTRPKQRVELVVTGKESQRKRNISMVRRKVEYDKLFTGGKTPAEHYFYIWDVMRKAGLPVLHSLGVLSAAEVLESDECADGSVIYGKDFTKSEGPLGETDEFFLKLNFEEVERKVRDIAKLATDNHIELSHDHAFDLKIHPQGMWEIMTRDIKNSYIGIEYPLEDPEDKIKRFMIRLEKIKELLSNNKMQAK